IVGLPGASDFEHPAIDALGKQRAVDYHDSCVELTDHRSDNRSSKNRSPLNAPPILPFAAPAPKASSSTTAISTGCPWTSPLCRWVAPRQNLPAGNAGPKAEATGYTWLIVQSFSPPPVTPSGGGLPLLPNP